MLDHVTIRSGDLEGTKAFLETVLGLEVGFFTPGLLIPGYWLYADGKPIVHLLPGTGRAGRPRRRDDRSCRLLPERP